VKIVRQVVRLMRSVWIGEGPKSLLDLAKEPWPKSTLTTSKLYVIETDFEVSPDTYNNMQAMLDGVREKYDLDFVILEPGFKLKRFDDY